MEFYQFRPQTFSNLCFFADIKKFSISLESLHFPTFSAKFLGCRIRAERGQWKIKKKAIEKSWEYFV